MLNHEINTSFVSIYSTIYPSICLSIFLVLLVLIFLVLRTIGSTEVIQSESEQSFSNLEGIQILIWLSLYLFLLIQMC